MPKATEKQIFFKTVGDMPPLAVSLFTMDYNKTGTWRNVRPVIDYGKCTFCAICWKYCPEPAIKLERVEENNKEKLKPIIDYDYCKGCGICWTECPVGAIHPEEEAE
mgnify:CR=1 FL=1